MGTIADNLLSLANTKAKLKQNLLYSGKDSSAENNFDDLVDMAFDGDDAFFPDPAWPQDLAAWTPEGGIGLIVSNFGLGKTSFIVDTASAQYTVAINDGTQDLSTTNYASGAQCDIDLGAGDGLTYRAIKITSTSAIQRFRVMRPAAVPSYIYIIPLLYFYGNLSGLNNCDYMFYPSVTTARCSLLQAVRLNSISNVLSMNMSFTHCASLRSLPEVLDTANVTSMIYTFAYCGSLRLVPKVLNTSKVTNMGSIFSYCNSLRSIPQIFDTGKVTGASNMFNSCYNLKWLPTTMDFSKATDCIGWGATMYSLSRVLLDFSSAVITSRLAITQAPGLKGLLVSSSATWTGTAPQIDITDCGLDRTALIALFNSLGTIAGKTIKITGNPGVPDLQAADLLIATAKGWTVTTT